jgi:hypothetical protein
MKHIPDPTSEISPDLALFPRTIDVQLPAARELFHYALTLLMLEDNKAECIARHVIDQREHLTFKTIAGEQYTLIKPDLSVEQLDHLRSMVRAVLRSSPPPASDLTGEAAE